MRATRVIRSSLLVLSLIASSGSFAAENTPDQQRVADAISKFTPDLKCDDPAIKSFDVEGTFGDGKTSLLFRAVQGEPGHFALHLVSPSGLPLVEYADDQAYIYDAIHGDMLSISRPALNFVLGQTSKSTVLKFGVGPVIGQQPTRTVVIGLHTFLDAAENCHVRQGGKRMSVSMRLPSTREATAEYDVSRVTPLESVSVVSKAPGDQLAMEIRHISINEPVDRALCALPSADEIKKVLPIREVETKDINWMMDYGRSAAFLLEANDPADRAIVDKNLGRIDWDATTRLQEKLAPNLKKLFKTAKTYPTTAPSTHPASNAAS